MKTVLACPQIGSEAVPAPDTLCQMPEPSWLYRAMIASPGDVSKERDAAERIIYEWNVHHGRVQAATILPVSWKTHSYPSFGDRPQAILNEQLLSQADILIAIFGERLGMPTGKAESGTVEEIETFAKTSKRSIAVYFRRGGSNLQESSDEERSRVEGFKRRIQKLGLYAEFDDLASFTSLFRQHITGILNELTASRLPPGIGLRPRTALKTLEDWPAATRAKDFLTIGLNLNIVLRQKAFFLNKLLKGAHIRLLIVNPGNRELLQFIGRGVVEQQHFDPDVGAALQTISDIRQRLNAKQRDNLSLRTIDYVPTLSFQVIDGRRPNGVVVAELTPNRVDVPSRPHLLLTHENKPWYAQFVDNCELMFREANPWTWD